MPPSCGVILVEWKQPTAVIFDQLMRLRDFIFGQSSQNARLAFGSIRIAANRGQCVPDIGAHRVRCGDPSSGLKVISNRGLGGGLSQHGSAQKEIESAGLVRFADQPKRIDHTHHLGRIGIAGAQRGLQLFYGFFKAARTHQAARLGHIGKNRAGQKGQKDRNGFHVSLRRGLAGLCLFAATASSPGLAQEALTANDFAPVNEKAAAVGRLLFYDKILSGNRNIACATCHERELGTSDGLSLGVGEGGVGLGPKRSTGEGEDRIERRVPRNSPGLWNLGARGVDTLFHDGRVQFSVRFGNGFDTPVDGALPEGLMSILAAQALMPVLSDVEMAGNPSENEVARAARRRPQDAWALLAARVEAIETYDILLRDAYPEIEGRLRIEHIANAIGEFMAFEYQSYDSPYDAFLAGDRAALNADAQAGMVLFFGKAGCSECHSGRLLSDQDFHALALPPLGPGQTRRFDPRARDLGRMNETDLIEDAYRFRTPMLRNVALTAPYGHNGTYPTLEGIVRHHLDPGAALAVWSRDLVSLPEAGWLLHGDYQVWKDPREMARLTRQIDIDPLTLSDEEIAEILAFMNALTGTESIKGRLGRPEFVPSGLPVD